jgi:hypothetical protein
MIEKESYIEENDECIKYFKREEKEATELYKIALFFLIEASSKYLHITKILKNLLGNSRQIM